MKSFFTCSMAALLLAACSSDGNVCAPGRTESCPCPGQDDGSQTCLEDGSGWTECDCPCIKACEGRECGPDPVCGESCGDCYNPCTEQDDPSLCIDGLCDNVCCPDCGYRECGPDPVCGTSCGECESWEECTEDGECLVPCTPDCTGRECGSDGCYDLCPPGCQENESCTDLGLCECTYLSCGGVCCGPGTVCRSDACVQVPCECNFWCAKVLGEVCNQSTGLCEPGEITGDCSSHCDCYQGESCVSPGVCQETMQEYCLSDGQCEDWEECELGFCVPALDCLTNADCQATVCLLCFEGKCVPSPPVCASDDDCCDGDACIFGVCVPNMTCQSDSDCTDPDFPRCVNGECVPECIQDIDCPPGQVCVDTHCVTPGCTPEDCPVGQWCDYSTGQCLPGCDQDEDCVPPATCNFQTHECGMNDCCGGCPPDQYCDSFICQCAGFCQSNSDCLPGFECFDDRCGCADYDVCPEESLCWMETHVCELSSECFADQECPPDFVCNQDLGFCEPAPGRGEGEPCFTDDHCDQSLGLLCDNDYYCLGCYLDDPAFRPSFTCRYQCSLLDGQCPITGRDCKYRRRGSIGLCMPGYQLIQAGLAIGEAQVSQSQVDFVDLQAVRQALGEPGEQTSSDFTLVFLGGGLEVTGIDTNNNSAFDGTDHVIALTANTRINALTVEQVGPGSTFQEIWNANPVYQMEDMAHFTDDWRIEYFFSIGLIIHYGADTISTKFTVIRTYPTAPDPLIDPAAGTLTFESTVVEFGDGMNSGSTGDVHPGVLGESDWRYSFTEEVESPIGPIDLTLYRDAYRILGMDFTGGDDMIAILPFDRLIFAKLYFPFKGTTNFDNSLGSTKAQWEIELGSPVEVLQLPQYPGAVHVYQPGPDHKFAVIYENDGASQDDVATMLVLNFMDPLSMLECTANSDCAFMQTCETNTCQDAYTPEDPYCKPCENLSECGDAANWCVIYNNGPDDFSAQYDHYCAPECVTQEDCPQGFTCGDVVAISGECGPTANGCPGPDCPGSLPCVQDPQDQCGFCPCHDTLNPCPADMCLFGTCLSSPRPCTTNADCEIPCVPFPGEEYGTCVIGSVCGIKAGEHCPLP